jgi:H+/Cl- antiporter ClcA
MTTPTADPQVLLRSRSYLMLLVFAALIGAPVSAVAYGFLALVSYLQKEIFDHLPRGLGFSATPVWWPLPVLFVGAIVAALAIKYLPGNGGPSPADGFKLHGPPTPQQLPGVILAALATLIFGIVLGPEMPLILIGGGLAVLATKLARKPIPNQAGAVLASTGSFAAVATLLGSPIVGAFLLMEASGLGGPMLGLVLIPGLLAAGIGSLIFIGLDHWTGLGTFSLSVSHLPHVGSPTISEFGWAIVIGLLAAVLGTAIHRMGLWLRPFSAPRVMIVLPLAGLVIGGLAIAYHAGSGKSSQQVLFDGQSALGPLLTHAAGYSAAILVLLIACKGLAYGVSLSAFRGGPTFPAMFIGAAIGLAFSHLPGLDAIAGAAMGIGAMSAVMLTLPLTSVLLATLLLGTDGFAVMPLAIVAVVVAYVVSARLRPKSDAAAAPAGAAAGSAAGAAPAPAAASADQPQPVTGRQARQ